MQVRSSLLNLRFSSDWDIHNSDYWKAHNNQATPAEQQQYFKQERLINSINNEADETKYTALLEAAYDNGKGIELLEGSLKQAHDVSVDFIRRTALFLAEKTK